MSSKTSSSTSKVRKTPQFFDIDKEASRYYPPPNSNYNRIVTGYSQTKVRGSGKSGPAVRITVS